MARKARRLGKSLAEVMTPADGSPFSSFFIHFSIIFQSFLSHDSAKSLSEHLQGMA